MFSHRVSRVYFINELHLYVIYLYILYLCTWVHSMNLCDKIKDVNTLKKKKNTQIKVTCIDVYECDYIRHDIFIVIAAVI